MSTRLSQEQLAEMAGLISIDILLSDNIHDPKAYLMDDIQAVFSDCDPDEIYVISEAAKAIKKSI